MLWTASAISIAAGQDPAADSIQSVDIFMFDDPGFPGAKFEIKISNDALPLWIAALERSDADLQRVTLDTLSIAQRRGMPGLEIALPKLIEIASRKELELVVRRAAIHALIQFDARDQASLLAELAQQYGSSVAGLVEPALVRWKSPVMADQWLQRINDPAAARQSLLTAMEGLGALRNESALEPLAASVKNDALAPAIRIAAARSLAQISDAGFDSQAQELIERKDQSVTNDLLALALLGRSDRPQSIELLKKLASRESSLVQSETLKRLYAIDYHLVLDFAESAITSDDVNVRWSVARAWIDLQAIDSVKPLATLLDDVNPTLRRHVAAELYLLAQESELRDEVISQVSAILDQDAWRGCEQATLVLVSLGHDAAGDRLVDLIRHPRGEVMSTAGWGLRKFALKKHLPAMLGRGQEIYQGFRQGELNGNTPGVVDLMAQLFMAFGQMDYRESDELIRAYAPRDMTLGENARAAAIWAAGYLYLDQAPEDLVKELNARLNDVEALIPEFGAVRQMSAISLGRMKAESALPDLRRFATEYPDSVSRSCHWSIERITGIASPMPTVIPQIADYDDWFLQPIGSQGSTEP